MPILEDGRRDDTPIADGPRSPGALVVGVCVHIRDFLHGPAKNCASRYTRPARPQWITNANHRDCLGCQSVRGSEMDKFTVEPEDMAETGFAEERRALRDCAKDRLHICRRAANNAEDVAGRCL